MGKFKGTKCVITEVTEQNGMVSVPKHPQDMKNRAEIKAYTIKGFLFFQNSFYDSQKPRVFAPVFVFKEKTPTSNPSLENIVRPIARSKDSHWEIGPCPEQM